MKRYKLWIAGLIFLGSCTNAQTKIYQNQFTILPAVNKNEKVATFAGGCFWAFAEGMSELKGVNHVIAGYASGTVKILLMKMFVRTIPAMQNRLKYIMTQR